MQIANYVQKLFVFLNHGLYKNDVYLTYMKIKCILNEIQMFNYSLRNNQTQLTIPISSILTIKDLMLRGPIVGNISRPIKKS